MLCSIAGFGRAATKLVAPSYILEKNSGSGHFPASIPIATVQSKTMQRRQSRTENSPVDVHVSYLVRLRLS